MMAGQLNRSNAEFVRALFDRGWNANDFAFLANRTAAEVPMHYNGTTMIVTAESLPPLVDSWRAAFPDLTMDIRHLVSDGDLVAASLVFRGSHLGEWWNIPATGKTVVVEETMFFRFSDGLLVEMWELFDEQSMRAQLTDWPG